MRLCKIFTVVCSNIIFLTVSAQQQAVPKQTDIGGQITNLQDAKYRTIVDDVTVYGGDNKIPYPAIKGSRFWRDEWQKAALYNKNTLLGIIPAKLNLINSELHILKDKEELVITDDITTLIFFKENDTSISTASFIKNVPNLFFNNKKMNDFVQVLNYGNYQLLKYTIRRVSSADSLFRTFKRYYFSDDEYYFLRSGDKVERVKKLNKENVMVFLPSSSAYANWISANKIDFKKERDVIRFLDYYNAEKLK